MTLDKLPADILHLIALVCSEWTLHPKAFATGRSPLLTKRGEGN